MSTFKNKNLLHLIRYDWLRLQITEVYWTDDKFPSDLFSISSDEESFAVFILL